MNIKISSDIHDKDYFCNLTSKLIAAYVANNEILPPDLPLLIVKMHAVLTGLPSCGTRNSSGRVRPTPVEIQASVQHEALISFEDGKPYKILKRHLKVRGLTPETYRAKWGLPSDYPMVAQCYRTKRSEIARALAIGQYHGALGEEVAAS